MPLVLEGGGRLLLESRGALLLESETGTEPGYPDGALDERIELLLGGAWTDITKYAQPDGVQSGSIKSGQPDGAQQPTPATMNATWDNPDYRLSPRNESGPWFGQLRQNTPARVSFASPTGTRLRLEANADDRAYVDDTAALHITGSLLVRMALRLSDWRGCVLAQRVDGTLPSWAWVMNADATMTFGWDDSGGTSHSITSPAPVPFTSGPMVVQAFLDAPTSTVTFWAGPGENADDSVPTLGAASLFTATTVRAGNCPLVAGWSGKGIAPQLLGEALELKLYSVASSLATAAADGVFSGAAPGSASWTDPQGNLWLTAGGAEITARDYRLHGELSSLVPTADVSGRLPRVAAILSGRLRRLQQGDAPAADSPMRRANLSQTGELYPVNYWTMEDGQVAKSFGPAAGSSLMTVGSGTVKPASDSSFEASAPLPQLNGASLLATVDSYTGGTACAVRFLFKEGSVLPASGTARLIDITTTGACTTLRVSVNPDGTLNFTGLLSGGATAFSVTSAAYPQLSGPAWWSVEATPSGSSVLYALVAIAPGATSGNTEPATVTGHGSFGNVTSFEVNPDLALDDSVVGHFTVQKAWTSMFSLGAPLNAWRAELAAARAARVCAENGIPFRLAGLTGDTPAMGAQAPGSVWTILHDCQNADQGLLFEPRDCLGVGLRTRVSMIGQSPAVTLSFAERNLPGDLQPADDDLDLVNDVTASTADGVTYRAVLDDGSPTSVSEPADGGAGRYASQPPQPFNLADASQLPDAANWYLAVHSVNEARYRQLTADCGIPGAPAADIARLRPGDLIVIEMPAAGNVICDTEGDPIQDTAGDPVTDGSTPVPGPESVYQSSDIRQLATGATEAFGPGRTAVWDCTPASPYDG